MRLPCFLVPSRGHEYRFVYSFYGIMGFVSGLIDCLGDVWDVKFFLITGLFLGMMFWSNYEFLVMYPPRKPFMASILLFVPGLLGYLGLWHLIWIMVWVILLGNPVYENLWVMPNIYVSYTMYTVLSIVFIIVYFIVGVLINTNDRVYRIYEPKRH